MAKRHVSYEVREEFFALVCGGMSLQSAARVAGVSDRSATSWWQASGLVSPAIQFGASGGLPGSAAALVPRDEGDDGLGRRRVLTRDDRVVIATGLRAGWSLRRIGRTIGRSPSVISREVSRNRGPDGSYWAPVAHRAAHERRRRPRTYTLAGRPGLCHLIGEWMDQGWSPELIARCLRSDSGSMMGTVSHETIYRALYVQSRGALRKDLHQQLSTRRPARKPRGTQRSTSPYRKAFTISQRPAEVADRAVPGHWEGDLIIGPYSRSAVGTLVERSTRFVMLLHLPERHDADTVAEAMISQMRRLPEHLRKSLTWDRGVELARYERIQLELAMPVYFCDPHSPWQRGTNENTNRLLRFWLEKGTDLSIHTPNDLDHIAATLNKRPRPTLDMKTPAQALAELLNNPAPA